MSRICSVIDCGHSHYAKGYCRSCYRKRQKAKEGHPANQTTEGKVVMFPGTPAPQATLEPGHTYRVFFNLGLRKRFLIADLLKVRGDTYEFVDPTGAHRFIRMTAIESAAKLVRA